MDRACHRPARILQSIAIAQPATEPTRRSWDLTPPAVARAHERTRADDPALAEPVLDRVERLLDQREYKGASQLGIQVGACQ
jgi:hypothetical protein